MQAPNASGTSEPLSRASAEDWLGQHLSQQGYSAAPLATWAASLEEGPTEHLQDLAAEVQSGLSRLEADKAGTLARCISLVEVSLTAPLPTGDAILIEEEQILSGRRRLRHHRPHVKLKTDEVPASGATRALRQRLGLSNEVIKSNFSQARCDEAATVKEATSSTFPGLCTRYAVHRVHFRLPAEAQVRQLGLPEGEPFATAEQANPSASSRDARVACGFNDEGCTHLWKWVPSDLACSSSGVFRSQEPIEDEPAEEPRQDCPSTTLEETYKDLQSVIKILEMQKASGAAGSLPAVEGMQRRLRRVMQRVSNVEELVHNVNIENVLPPRGRIRRGSTGSSESTALPNDLRDFISFNFMDHHALAEARRSRGDDVSVKLSMTPRADEDMRKSSPGSSATGADTLGRQRSSSMPASPTRRRNPWCSEVSFAAPAPAPVPDDDEDEQPMLIMRTRSLPFKQHELGASNASSSERHEKVGEASWQSTTPASSSTSLSPTHSRGIAGKRVKGSRQKFATAGASISTVAPDDESPWEASIHREAEKLQESGASREWVLDCLKLSDVTNGASMLVTAELIVLPQVDDFGTSPAVMRRFISALHGRYSQNNPFHSESHGAQVAHATHWLVSSGKGWGVAPVVERVATDIAALGHDAGHFRRNNAFCISTGHWVAVTYNDRSVLENMHASTCFQLMKHEERNILRTLTNEHRREFRQHVVDLILSTDLASHFEFLAQFRLTVASGAFDVVETRSHHKLFTKSCLKAADLGHTALPWHIHEPWVIRLVTEFYEQGDEERSMGIPVSPMCAHTSDIADFRNSQKGFLECVVLPLYKELSQVLDVSATCVSSIEQNAAHWITGELSEELTGTVTGKAMSPKAMRAKQLRLLPPTNNKEETREDVLKPGDEVWVRKTSSMRGKVGVVIDPCWKGSNLIKVQMMPETTSKGIVRIYTATELELAISVPIAAKATFDKLPDDSSSGFSSDASAAEIDAECSRNWRRERRSTTTC